MIQLAVAHRAPHCINNIVICIFNNNNNEKPFFSNSRAVLLLSINLATHFSPPFLHPQIRTSFGISMASIDLISVSLSHFSTSIAVPTSVSSSSSTQLQFLIPITSFPLFSTQPLWISFHYLHNPTLFNFPFPFIHYSESSPLRCVADCDENLVGVSVSLPWFGFIAILAVYANF